MKLKNDISCICELTLENGTTRSVTDAYISSVKTTEVLVHMKRLKPDVTIEKIVIWFEDMGNTPYSVTSNNVTWKNEENEAILKCQVSNKCEVTKTIVGIHTGKKRKKVKKNGSNAN